MFVIWAVSSSISFQLAELESAGAGSVTYYGVLISEERAWTYDTAGGLSFILYL